MRCRQVRPDGIPFRRHLQAAGSEREFIDTASGKIARRPELDKLIEVLLPGDTVVVWKLDRLGRSIKDLIEVVTGLGGWCRTPVSG